MSAAYDPLRYVGNMVNLYVFSAEGREDGQEADRVRNEMDVDWYEMPVGDRSRMQAISVALGRLAEAVTRK